MFIFFSSNFKHTHKANQYILYYITLWKLMWTCATEHLHCFFLNWGFLLASSLFFSCFILISHLSFFTHRGRACAFRYILKLLFILLRFFSCRKAKNNYAVIYLNIDMLGLLIRCVLNTYGEATTDQRWIHPKIKISTSMKAKEE